MSSEVGMPWGGLWHLMQSITERERMHSSSRQGEDHLCENSTAMHITTAVWAWGGLCVLTFSASLGHTHLHCKIVALNKHTFFFHTRCLTFPSTLLPYIISEQYHRWSSVPPSARKDNCTAEEKKNCVEKKNTALIFICWKAQLEYVLIH